MYRGTTGFEPRVEVRHPGRVRDPGSPTTITPARPFRSRPRARALRALVAAVEKGARPRGLPAAPYAEAGARAVADALAAAGFPAARTKPTCSGPVARLAVLRSSPAGSARSPPPASRGTACSWPSFLPHPATPAGPGSSPAWDTQTDDPADTALSVADLIGPTCTRSRAAAVTLLLDARPAPRGWLADLDAAAGRLAEGRRPHGGRAGRAESHERRRAEGHVFTHLRDRGVRRPRPEGRRAGAAR